MNLEGKVVLLTGATSGIGYKTAKSLALQKAHLILIGRKEEDLKRIQKELSGKASSVAYLTADLSHLDGLTDLVEKALTIHGHIDVLINNAGIISFKYIENESLEDIELLYRTNVLAPIRLTTLLVPHLKARDEAQVVNIGSIFGSISYAYFSVYSSSKFAIRGFSEALRRELQDTSIQVLYVAPRATRTKLASLFGKMAEKTNMKLDPPDLVAQKIISSMIKEKKDSYLGFPECFFVRLNSIFPRLVDNALKKDNKIMSNFAE